MGQPFKLPDLGEGIHEGEIRSVLVKVGDQVKEGQPILEVETDKARVEIPSPFTGTVEEIRVKPEEVVKVGTALVVIGESEDAASMPETGRLGRDPRPPTKPTPIGTARKLAEVVQEAVAGDEKVPVKRGEGPVPASPATRRLARELGVDLREVPGTGGAGLVTAADVRAFAERGVDVPKGMSTGSAQEGAALAEGHLAEGEAGMDQPVEMAPLEEPTAPPAAVELPPLPDFGRWGKVERARMRPVRRATARHMSLAWSQIPHACHQESVDVTRLEQFRREHAAEVETAGGKLSLMVFVMKAAVAALKAYPQFNASLDPAAEEIILKRYYHLGIAVDTDRGLVVPVIRDVDRKSLTELSVELKEVARRTRAAETALEEMQGGTFTITNVGPLGGTGFVPIVNYPEVAILGMGRARLQPVVVGDENDCEIVPRLMLPVALGFDHRVVDGADAARFVRAITEALETPDQLWLRI